MAWTTPMTATANSAFTAAQFNTHVRDNLLETAPGKATASGQWFVSTGANAIAARTIGFDTVGTPQSTTSTSYTNLATAGPAVTVTTGAYAFCIISAQLQHSLDNVMSRISVQVSGATTIAASDGGEWLNDGTPAGQPISFSKIQQFMGTLTPGSNTFTLKYRTGSGTATFAERDLFVFSTS